MSSRQPDRDFWRRALLSPRSAAVPRWSCGGTAGWAQHEAQIPAELVTALRRLAKGLNVHFSSVLLTAHARALGVLTGERTVRTGYAFQGGSPLPLAMTLGPRSWRELLLGVALAEAELLAHRDFPVGDLARELGVTGPLFETVFERHAVAGQALPEHVAMGVTFAERQGLRLLLRYRTDMLQAEYAARIAGYHCRALELIALDPAAEHSHKALLLDEELRFRLHGLAGRHFTRPDASAAALAVGLNGT